MPKFLRPLSHRNPCLAAPNINGRSVIALLDHTSTALTRIADNFSAVHTPLFRDAAAALALLCARLAITVRKSNADAVYGATGIGGPLHHELKRLDALLDLPYPNAPNHSACLQREFVRGNLEVAMAFLKPRSPRDERRAAEAHQSALPWLDEVVALLRASLDAAKAAEPMECVQRAICAHCGSGRNKE